MAKPNKFYHFISHQKPRDIWAYSIVALVMMLFGYLIASHNQKALELRLENEMLSRNLLAQENQQLQSRVSELEVSEILARSTGKHTEDELHLLQAQVLDLEAQLSFYQRVMAPEKIRNGFFIDSVQVTPTASDNEYRLQALLLQQYSQKVLLKGVLNMVIKGSKDGKPYSLEPGQSGFLPDGRVPWRFRYFQALDIRFTLPVDFIPEEIIFTTAVVKWKTKQGDYSLTVDWSEVFNESLDEAPE